MLTYSLGPRGGVVHALEVAEALSRRGHLVTLMALGRPGEHFFREPAVPHEIVRYEPRDAPIDERIMAMLGAYRDGLASLLGGGEFDAVHSQDCLSANAALELRELGIVPHVIRTVHHVERFTSPSLIECQLRSIIDPDAVLCVSAPWVGRLADGFGVRAGLVRNGVDTRRFRPPESAAERDTYRTEAGFGDRLVVLTVGGIEPRKGSLTLLDAFAELHKLVPDRDPLLVIVGGTTLFDYRHEVDRFHVRMAELGVEPYVRIVGSLPCGELERLYRAADLFAFPSTAEGFGLAALEALASGIPVVASDIAPLRTFLEHDRSALLVPAQDAGALASSLGRLAGDVALRRRLKEGGLRVSSRYTWAAAAAAYEHAYEELLRKPRLGPAAEPAPPQY
jgi:glycosyltransferase-like protein